MLHEPVAVGERLGLPLPALLDYHDDFPLTHRDRTIAGDSQRDVLKGDAEAEGHGGKTARGCSVRHHAMRWLHNLLEVLHHNERAQPNDRVSIDDVDEQFGQAMPLSFAHALKGLVAY